MYIRFRPLLPYLLHLILFVLGFGVCYYYGRSGVMPLDQSIIFDGAWRVLTGQIPFRDFVTPNGFVPIYLQAIIFSFLGVSWSSYLIHAAIFNGLFTNMAFDFLSKLPIIQTTATRSIPKWKLSSFIMASLSALVFYPPFGVPYMEQHSFFFGMVLLWIIGLTIRTNSSGSFFFLAILISVSIVLAWLSKQIPTVIFAPLFLCYLAAHSIPRLRLLALGLISGGFISFLGLYFLAKFYRLNHHLLNYYYLELPKQTGSGRLAIFQKPDELLEQLKNIVTTSQLSYLIIIVGVIAIAYLIDEAYQLIGRLSRYKIVSIRHTHCLISPEAFLLISLLATSILFPLLTWQNLDNGKPYIFLAAGVAELYLCTRLPKRTGVILRSGLIAVGIFAGYTFSTSINQGRLVHFEVQSPIDRSVPIDLVPPEFSTIVFDLPVFARKTRSSFDAAQDLSLLIEFLREKNSPFFLLGDCTFLYGMLRQPSIQPSLWYHPGLTIPPETDPEFIRLQRRIIDNIRKFKARYVVLEGEKTWLSASLVRFPLVEAFIKARLSQTTSLGMFTVIELSTDRRQN